MYLIYTVLALAEVCVLLVSGAAVLVFVLRGIVSLFRAPPPEQRAPKPEDLRHLKRAGQSG